MYLSHWNYWSVFQNQVKSQDFKSRPPSVERLVKHNLISLHLALCHTKLSLVNMHACVWMNRCVLVLISKNDEFFKKILKIYFDSDLLLKNWCKVILLFKSFIANCSETIFSRNTFFFFFFFCPPHSVKSVLW